MSTFDSLTGNLTPQSILLQRYLIVQLAGRGGMSAIYQALDTHMGRRRVAIKEMSQQNLNEQERLEAVARFRQEAHLLGTLKHPNMPRIYDAFGIGGRSFLVMDFIEGQTLLQLLQEAQQPLAVNQVLHYAIQLCDVLTYLHQQQPPIIFRDLKPTNVMVTPHGHVYLIDFGIARFFKEGQPQDTIMLGSPGYAPPEQHGSGQTTPRSDLYALGATLHCCLSNRDPYHATDRFTFAPVRQFNLQVPVALDQLILRLLSLNESKRPASALEVKQALIHISQQAQQSNAHTPVPPPMPSAASTQYVGPRHAPDYQATQPAQGQAGAQEKLILPAPPQSVIHTDGPGTLPMTPSTHGQAYPRHPPTPVVRHTVATTRLWTRGFLLAFLLLLIVTVGGSTVAFNIANPYGSTNPAGLDHATEAALAALALLISFTTLMRAHNWLAGLAFLLNGVATLSLGLAFSQLMLSDMQPSTHLFIQFSPTQISQILLYAPLVAGISLLLWHLHQGPSWGQRLCLVLFGGAVCLCALLQASYIDSAIPKHMLLLGALIVLIQSLLVAGQIAHQGRKA
jgi:serine/threonine protein kinase